MTAIKKNLKTFKLLGQNNLDLFSERVDLITKILITKAGLRKRNTTEDK